MSSRRSWRCQAIAGPLPRSRHGLSLGLALLALLAALAFLHLVTGQALGSASTKVVRYHSYRLAVPANWPVFRLSAKPTTCVRFNRHAVYLGRPSAQQRCPAHAAGRTESILIEPPAPGPREASVAGPQATVLRAPRGVVVTATWARHSAVIRRALHVRGLRPAPERGAGAVAARRTTGVRAAPARASAQPAQRATGGRAANARAGAAAAAAGAVYTGLGFDACATPSAATMSAWATSGYQALGIYVGGANMACSQPNLTAAWVSQESAVGWHMIPIYVGLQAPSNSCGCAAISPAAAPSQGTAAAADAVASAQALGLGPGNPVYFDMEAYSPGTVNTGAVLTFLSAWTAQLHAAGYKSGVYASADSGIRDLAAQYGTAYLEPDDIWIARWNEAQNTIEPNVPPTAWAAHQRIHQYDGGHNETHGGVRLNIDGDYVDAATAAAGAGAPLPSAVAAAPSLSVSPTADGGIELRPSWNGFAGISSWEVVGGPAPTTLSPVSLPISANARPPIRVRSAFAYFGVLALGATGQTLGSSAPVATPPHVAIVGNSAFVPSRGLGGLPVGCFNTVACHVSTTITTITAGRTSLAATGPEHIPAGGGLTYFKLSPSAHRLVLKARHRRLAVRITVRDVSGSSVTRPLNLIPFATSGASALRSLNQAPTLRIVGATDFVSHAGVGGILAACFSTFPCHPSTTITVAGRVVARTTPEFLGVNELGYLIFRLTGAGRTLLAHARGNQLGARVTVNDGGTIAGGQIVLASFT